MSDLAAQLLALMAALGAVVVVIVLIQRSASRGARRRLMEAAQKKGALVVTSGSEPRALYLVATLRGRDDARLAAAWKKAPDGVLWCSESPRDIARGLWFEVTRALEREWPGSLTDAVKEKLAHELDVRGVELVEVQLAADVLLDDAADARRKWWVRYVHYDPDSSAYFHCDGLEYFLDATSGTGLWWFRIGDRVWTSAAAAKDPTIRLSVCPAGKPQSPKKLALDEMATVPPAE